MKCIATIACMFALLFSTDAFSQSKGLGLKAGLNFVNVKNVKSISDANSGSKTGFHAGIFFAPKTSGLLGYRSEILFSRQGYDFKTTTATGDVMMDYILLPQLMTFNITKYVQLQIGGQMGILINAKADSVSTSSQTSTLNKAMDYYNKINYGVAGGVEIKPVAGLVIGGRYNAFFGSLNEQASSGSTGLPSFIPTDGKKLKNGLVQLYVGYRF
ncbi:MAG: porin family protein [Chitinophagaceae bacterium]